MEEIKNMDRVLVEIKEILKYVTKDMYNKIPSNIKKIINEYSNSNYEFKYDFSKELIEQNICEDTKNFIGYLHYNYWADSEGKRRIEKVWDENQEAINNKYDYDNLFKNEEKKFEKDSAKNITSITIKESWYKKIFNKIKSLFGF